MDRSLLPALFSALLLVTAAPAFSAETDDGKIVSVSADEITIGRKHPKTYKITANTSMSANGQRVSLAGLRQGMDADVLYESGVALSISANEATLKGSKLETSKAKKSK